MATSFGWKNKRLKLNKSSDSTGAFSEEAQVDPGAVDDDVDWLHNIPIKRQCIQLEDVSEKTKRLTEEGVALAEQGRYWEAITRWDESLNLKECEKILEMKAQALIDLNELYPAVTVAKQAVARNRRWWISHQTLGRALLNIGEINEAIINFQKAIHLHPDDSELWKEDLFCAMNLLQDLHKKSSDMSKDELSFHVRQCMRVGVSNIVQYEPQRSSNE